MNVSVANLHLHSFRMSMTCLASCLLWACASPSEQDTDLPNHTWEGRPFADFYCKSSSGHTIEHDTQACSSFHLPSQMGFGWDLLNHRISIYESALTPHDQCEAEQVHATFVGGDFTTGEALDDLPYIRFETQHITQSDASCMGAARVQLPARIDPSGVYQASVDYSRAELGLTGYETVVALIEGIAFDTNIERAEQPGYPDDYEPRFGYAMRGLGAEADVNVLDSENLSLDFAIYFETGLTHDRLDHNEAVGFAHIDARLDVILLGLNRVPVVTGDIEYHLAYPKPEPLKDSTLEPASLDQQRVVLQGATDGPDGIYGLSAFRFKFDPGELECRNNNQCPEGNSCSDTGVCDEALGKPGYYMREISVGVAQDNYDHQTGEATFYINGYASNTTSFLEFYGLNSHFRAQMVWIQSPSTVETRAIDETFETGTHLFELQ